MFEAPKADDGGFDTDVAIATGELVKLIPDLIEAPGRRSRKRRGQRGGAIAAGDPCSGSQSSRPALPHRRTLTAAATLPPRKSARAWSPARPLHRWILDPESAPF